MTQINPIKKSRSFFEKTTLLAFVAVSALPASRAFAATSASPASPMSTAIAQQQERYKNLELFQKVLHFIEQNYVDEDKVKNQDLIYGAIKGMMETLDPHSNFLPPELYKDMKVDTSGKFGGLGIEIGVKDNILTVIAPIEDTPAWKAGIKSGDRILKIGGESTKGMNLEEAVKKMRGKKSSDVQLSVFREGWDKIHDFHITRAEIKVQSVKSEDLGSDYGYVRLSSFNEKAAEDIQKALDQMERKNGKKLRGLVFDLRGNPGGLLDQAVEVCSLFIDEGVVVSTIPRNKDQKEVKYAHKGKARKDLPVAVLVSSSSASAAEIVAGCLQDHHRAVIMGQSTFGKGSVQTVVPLNEDGNDDAATVGLKLTIARYYTPSGKSIQDKGVMPDILLEEYDPKLLAEAKRKGDAFRERDLKGHMLNPDGEAAGDGSKDFDKEDLEAMSAKDKDKKKDKLGKESKEPSDDELAPTKINPKEDYQVKEALNYLKSYEIFRQMATSGGKVVDAPSSEKTVSQK